MISQGNSATAITAAVDWLRAISTGTLASTIGILAIASIGFLMLSGRLDVRRSVQVLIGCFVVFGASSIAAGLLGATEETRTGAASEFTAETPAYAIAPVPAVSNAVAIDPYAAAALPSRP